MSTIGTLTEIFQDIFDNDDIALGRDTTAADVAGWDSVMNVRLFLEIESEFGVRFNAGEVAALKNVGQLVDFIDSRR